MTFDLDHQPPATTASWPHPFRVRFRVTIGRLLTMTLQVTHLGEQPAAYEPALHPYFHVGDISRVRISGLDTEPFTDRSPAPRSEQGLTFDEEGIDRVFSSSSPVTIHDDANNRDIILHAAKAKSRIIWNPGAKGSSSMPDLGHDDWQSFLCVEPGNVQEHAITLNSGQQHRFTAVIQVVPQMPARALPPAGAS